MSNALIYSAIMLAAGIGIPVMAAMNARVGTAFSSPTFAVIILIAVAAVTALIALTILGKPQFVIPDLPPYYLFPGVLFILYILSITWIAPRFGIGNAVFFVLLGQLISAALIDHYGLFGARQIPIDATRIVGLILMTIAVFLSVRRH